MNNPVIILGAGGLGKVAQEIFQSNGIVVYCFLDDNKALHNTEINNVAVMGSTDDDGYLKLIGKKCEAFIATDDNKLRMALAKMLFERRKVMPVNALHHAATIEPSAWLGYGNMVGAKAVVNTNAKIQNNCIVQTGAIIDFDVQLEDLVQVGVGSILSSGVKVGQGAFIGSGVTVVSGITIGKNARIGAGSVVVADVKDGETVFGNPAKAV